jgi:hypothetical protein
VLGSWKGLGRSSLRLPVSRSSTDSEGQTLVVLIVEQAPVHGVRQPPLQAAQRFLGGLTLGQLAPVLQRLALPGDSTQAMQPNELLDSGRACHRNGRASVMGAGSNGQERASDQRKRVISYVRFGGSRLTHHQRLIGSPSRKHSLHPPSNLSVRDVRASGHMSLDRLLSVNTGEKI